MISFSNIHPKLKSQCVLMDYCVTDVAELIKAHVVQLNFLGAPLYILPSFLHLGIACTVSQGLKSKKTCTRKFVRSRGATSSPLA